MATWIEVLKFLEENYFCEIDADSEGVWVSLRIGGAGQRQMVRVSSPSGDWVSLHSRVGLSGQINARELFEAASGDFAGVSRLEDTYWVRHSIHMESLEMPYQSLTKGINGLAVTANALANDLLGGD
jgi:hypothetical protein